MRILNQSMSLEISIQSMVLKQNKIRDAETLLKYNISFLQKAVWLANKIC